MLRAARRHGGSFAEVFVEERSSTSIRLDDGKVEELTTGLDRGAGVRVAQGTSYGYAYSNRLDRDSLLQAAEAASAALRGDAPGAVVDLTERVGAGTNRVERPAGDLPAADKVAWLRELDDTARAYSPEVVQVGGRLRRLAAATADRDERRRVGAGGPPADPPRGPGGRQARRQHPDRVPRAGGVQRGGVPRGARPARPPPRSPRGAR